MDRRFLFDDVVENFSTEHPSEFSVLPVLKEFPYDRKGSFRNGNPYVIVFCYCKDGNKFVVKGGYNPVAEFLSSYPKPLFIHRTIWRHGVWTLTAGVSGKGWSPGWTIHIFRKKIRGHGLDFDRRGWEFAITRQWSNKTREAEFTRRRLPRQWMKELNEYCEK